MPTGNSSVKRPHGFSGVLYMIGRNGVQHKTTNAVWPATALAAACANDDPTVPGRCGGYRAQSAGRSAASRRRSSPLPAQTVFAETILRSAKAGGRCLPWGYSCNPHSVLSSPDQRPARECSPGATGRVQGQQPIEV